MTAMTTEGSILAVRKVWGRMRLTPTQKMSIEPTSDRLSRAAVVMMGESAPANSVIVPWNTATGRAEKMQPRQSEAVMVQTMMQSRAPMRASVDQSPSRPS